MAKMIQVRNVPDRLHAELVRRIRERTPVEFDRPVSELIREDRELREDHLPGLTRIRM